jgi:integrase
MSRSLYKLHAKSVATIQEYGSYSDGGGLALIVKPDRRSWVFRYSWQRKERYMGLGSAKSVSLADARVMAAKARLLVSQGIDPIAANNQQERKIPTFGEMADEYIEKMKSQWSNEKHIAQWKMTLAEYAKPLRHKPVNEIGTDDVRAVLEPIWLDKHETASRLRGRIEAVLAAATARGLREGANPAQWRNHLDRLLPTQPTSSRTHHGAMAYPEVPELIKRLHENGSVSALALEFLILSASRTSEVLLAQWSEIDFNQSVWTIPWLRMKAKKEHRVPLSGRSVEILKTMSDFGKEGFIFPGRLVNRPLSNMALEALLRRFDLKKNNVTVHGFRSSFRDYIGEETDFPRDLAEIALAHNVGDAVERAYRRGDAIEKRRKMMDAWADYLHPSQT